MLTTTMTSTPPAVPPGTTQKGRAPRPIRSDAGLASALRISVARLARRLRREGGTELGATHLAALATLERHGSLTPRELAEREKVRPPSMTRVIAALEQRGLVSRSPHEVDGRQVILALTREGTELLREERRRREQWLTRRVRELTPEEREILRAAVPILEKLSQA